MSANACLPTPISRLAAVAVVFLAVAGCATQKSIDLPELGAWEQRQAILGELDQWDFSGRIAIRTGDDGFNARLRWHQDDDDFEATVAGPLGTGTVRIEVVGDRVEITDKDGATTALRDIEAELWYRYGWKIPVESLRYWVLGIPDPRVPSKTDVGDDDLLVTLTQRDWEVSVSDYREVGGQQMPRRLAAKNAETSVRLVVDRWVFRER